MKNTGVFATEEELKECKELLHRAQTTPMIAINLPGGGPSGWSWEDVKKRCHTIAMERGLPEIAGYYGMTKDGEFVTT